MVRNALDNLRDILQEATYSPFMGKTSHTQSLHRLRRQAPQQNFAREIMQLFTTIC